MLVHLGKAMVLIFVFFAVLAFYQANIYADIGEQHDALKTYIERGGDFIFEEEYEAAAREYEKAIELDTGNMELRRSLVEAYFMAGYLHQALEVQKFVIERDPAAGDYYNLGKIYKGLGENEEALQAFSKCANLYNLEDSWQQLGMAYASMKDYKEAVYAYRKVLEINPSNGVANYELIRNSYRIGDYKGAISEISRIFDTTGSRIFLALSFFKHLLPPFILAVAIILFSRWGYVSNFLGSSKKEGYRIARLCKMIILFFVIYFFLPHLAHNPFSGHYFERSVASAFLYKNPAGLYWGHIFSLFVSLGIFPIYCMRAENISVIELLNIEKSKRKNLIKYLGVGLLIFCIIYVLEVGVTLYFRSSQPAQRVIYTRDLTFLIAVSSCVVGPFLEELCYRGWIFSTLNKYFKIGWSILLSSMFFVIAHYYQSGIQVIFSFIFGVLSAYLVHKTKSLWPSIGLHTISNTAYLCVAILRKG